MAKSFKQASSSANIDWYLISIEKLKRIGVIALILLVALGGWLYWNHRQSSPRILAERAIRLAQDALDQIAGSKEFNNFRLEYDRAHLGLEQARSLFNGRKYPDARRAAEESLSVAQTVIARLPGQGDADAVFLTVEGEVLFQKRGGDWKAADVRTPLVNGDWVKTAANASAELVFSNGSLYTIGPNALLEIYSMRRPGSDEKQNSVTMQIGSIEVSTHEEVSTVRTSGSQVVVESQSTTQVGVNRDQATDVVNLRGGAQVTSPAAGTRVRLGEGEQVAATRQGQLSEVTKVTPPPALQSPGDNVVYQARPDLTIPLEWDDQALAKRYQLQVSRSRLFTTQEINAPRDRSRAVVKVSSEGAFYWRVASIDENGRVGPFSGWRRFRVVGAGSSLEDFDADKTAPALQVKRPFNFGGRSYLIEGKVEPGASVFVNDDEVTDVTNEGNFKKLIELQRVGWNTVVIKAVDLAGNQAVQREKVYAEE